MNSEIMISSHSLIQLRSKSLGFFLFYPAKQGLREVACKYSIFRAM